MNIQALMKQAQKMQAGLAAAQDKLAQQTLTHQDASGKITVTVTGAGELMDLKIAPEILDPNDAEFVQELILAAIRQATAEAKTVADAEMKKLTGGMGLPPGMGL